MPEKRRRDLRLIEGGKSRATDDDRDAELLLRLLEASEARLPSDDPWLSEQRERYREQAEVLREKDDRRSSLTALIEAADRELEEQDREPEPGTGPLADVMEALDRFLSWAQRQLE